MTSGGRGRAAQQDETAKLFQPFTGERLQNLFLIIIFTSIPSAALVLGLVLNHDSTAFHLSDLRNGYHPGPQGRGTLSLVWSCVSTIFTLIHVSVHPDIPNDREDVTNDQKDTNNDQEDTANDQEDTTNDEEDVTSEKGGVPRRDRNVVVHFIRRALSLAFWPVMNIFSPSLVVLVASMEYQSARDGVAFMRTYTKQRGEEGCRWTMRHAFFADMGGFERAEGKPFLTGRDFYEYVRDKSLRLKYNKIEAEIRDRSNKNTVLKVLTFVQASWFIAQSIIRAVEQRAISQLEVTTCAYIFSLMAAYLFWIRKPYRVGGRILLENMVLHPKDSTKIQQRPQVGSVASSAPSLAPSGSTFPQSKNPASGDQDDAEKGGVSPSQRNLTHPPLRRASTTCVELPSSAQPKLPSPPVQLPDSVEPSGSSFTPFNRAMYKKDRAWAYSCFTSGVVCALIGLIHLLPFWDRDYANPMGKILWRVCGIVQVCLSLGLATGAVLERKNMPKRFLWPLWIGMGVMAFAYCVSRFVIFTLIWYSFSSLPDAVYDSIDWSWFPHWY